MRNLSTSKNTTCRRKGKCQTIDNRTRVAVRRADNKPRAAAKNKRAVRVRAVSRVENKEARAANRVAKKVASRNDVSQ